MQTGEMKNIKEMEEARVKSSKEFRISYEIKSDKAVDNTGFAVYRSLSEMRNDDCGIYN